MKRWSFPCKQGLRPYQASSRLLAPIVQAGRAGEHGHTE